MHKYACVSRIEMSMWQNEPNYQRIVTPVGSSNRHTLCSCICLVSTDMLVHRLIQLCACDFTSTESVSVAPIADRWFGTTAINKKKSERSSSAGARMGVVRCYNQCFALSVCNTVFPFIRAPHSQRFPMFSVSSFFEFYMWGSVKYQSVAHRRAQSTTVIKTKISTLFGYSSKFPRSHRQFNKTLDIFQ